MMRDVPRSRSIASSLRRTSWWGRIPGLGAGSSVTPRGSHTRSVVLSSCTNQIRLMKVKEKSITSVRETGTFFPTMFPTVQAFARILVSNSFASFFFASTCASISFFAATRSSAGSFACIHHLHKFIRGKKTQPTFFFADICFCTSFTFFLNALVSKSTISLFQHDD